MRTTNREKPLLHKLCSFTSILCTCLLVHHLYGVFFQYMFWYGLTSETAWMQRRQKNWLKYTDFTELQKITSRIYSKCSNYSSLFFKSFKFLCCWFCFIIKQFTVNCTCVLLILLLLHSTFFKGKVKLDFWWILLFFYVSGL